VLSLRAGLDAHLPRVSGASHPVARGSDGGSRSGPSLWPAPVTTASATAHASIGSDFRGSRDLAGLAAHRGRHPDHPLASRDQRRL
jgi:hypothetical protein